MARADLLGSLLEGRGGFHGFDEGLHPRGPGGKFRASYFERHDTLELHTQGGKFTPARERLHKQIITKALKGHVAQDKPKALFTAGGAASGKTAVLTKVPGTPADAVMVNADHIKEQIPEYHALKKAGRHDLAAAAVHEESSRLAAEIAARAMAAKRHVIIDGVGNSGGSKFAKKVEAAARTHEVTVRYAHVSVRTALRRERERAERTGRHVPEATLRRGHRGVALNYVNGIEKMPGIHVEVYDTSGPKKATSLPLIASRKAGSAIVVHDRRGYSQFRAKRIG